MATTTPNFGWPVPTSTDLVKDGATAIEALGDGVDASMVDLKGGLTGQVLAKTTNADMDFTWVTTDDTNAIQNSIVDAKGDLIAASAADTPARLAVGNNGETLLADSSTSTGLRYQVAKSLNGFYNSAFDIWQRGTSAIGTGYNYAADRFLVFRGAFAAGSTFSRVASTQAGFQYAMKVQRDSGNTSTAAIYVRQALETTDSERFAGQTITVSFYAKAGANYSAASSYLVSNTYAGQGTDQAATDMTVWTTVATSAQNNVLTTSWQRFSQTVAIGSAKTQFGIEFVFTPVGTAGADDSYQITGVQVEVGSVATGFQRQTGSIQQELAACQRYYYRNLSIDSNTVFGSGWGWTGTQATLILNTKVTMRTKPSALDYSSINLQAVPAGTTYAITSWTLDTGLLGADTIATIPVVASGLTASLNYRLIGASGSAYVGLSAEL
jgi:hypothetical protein